MFPLLLWILLRHRATIIFSIMELLYSFFRVGSWLKRKQYATFRVWQKQSYQTNLAQLVPSKIFAILPLDSYYVTLPLQIFIILEYLHLFFRVGSWLKRKQYATFRVWRKTELPNQKNAWLEPSKIYISTPSFSIYLMSQSFKLSGAGLHIFSGW